MNILVRVDGTVIDSPVTAFVEKAPLVQGGDGREIDAYIAPSGVRYEYSDGRVTDVCGQPTITDEVMFIRHMANRRAFGKRVLGVSMGGGK